MTAALEPPTIFELSTPSNPRDSNLGTRTRLGLGDHTGGKATPNQQNQISNKFYGVIETGRAPKSVQRLGSVHREYDYTII
jgi:hypothetical protein